MADENAEQGDLLKDDAGKAADGDKGSDAAKAAADAGKGAADDAGKDKAADADQGKDDGKKAADDKGKAAEPITYAEFKAPEGMTLDKAALEGVTPMFQKLGLNQEQAQELVTFYANQVKTAGEANAKAWGETIKSWQTALKADEEFGGAKLEETQSLAAKAIDAYGGKDAPEIREFMKTYGLGDHPAFARFLARAGRTVREDGLPRPNGGAQVRDARALYPNSNMN